VAHDAGAAEQLSAMVVAECDRYAWHIVAPQPSPARTIFERKGLKHLSVPDTELKVGMLLEEIQPACLIAGTGTSGYELAYIRKARQQGVRSIAWLDHWVNYRERFGYPDQNWQEALPDLIAVSDSCAYGMAQNLDLGPLVKLRNYYLDELVSRYRSETAAPGADRTLLYISEAIEEHWTIENGGPPRPEYTQTEVLRHLLENFGHLSSCLGVDQMVVRMHPAESPVKYLRLLACYPNVKAVVEIPGARNLSSSIASARAVIGITSMALLNAHLLGKPTISYIPRRQRCDLPLPSACCLNSLDDLCDDLNVYVRSRQPELEFFDDCPLDTLMDEMELLSSEDSRHY
jgi:hypothetical protein